MVWEISQCVIIDMVVDWGVYICQSQSMNFFVQNLIFGKLLFMYFYVWEQGFKIGMYYLCSKVVVNLIKFMVKVEV